jgi:folate-binding Fe-S cluster repair protein YgfZ
MNNPYILLYSELKKYITFSNNVIITEKEIFTKFYKKDTKLLSKAINQLCNEKFIVEMEDTNLKSYMIFKDSYNEEMEKAKKEMENKRKQEEDNKIRYIQIAEIINNASVFVEINNGIKKIGEIVKRDLIPIMEDMKKAYEEIEEIKKIKELEKKKQI